MDSTPTHQAPCGPMTRARACAIETEVNSLLYEIDMDMDGTWMLPHQRVLCVITYEDDLREAAKEHPKGIGEGPQGHKEDDGNLRKEDNISQATPCARASLTPCPWSCRVILKANEQHVSWPMHS